MTTRFKLTTFCKGSRLIRERVGNVIKVDFRSPRVERRSADRRGRSGDAA